MPADQRLLERDAELDALASFWARARAGHGRLILLGGEGGSGKTSVGLEFTRRIGPPARILVGTCDSGARPRTMGALIDIAGPLGLAGQFELPDLRQASLFPRVRDALSGLPTVLVLEDVHNADEVTLDLLRYLGRRLGSLPVLVVATFRDDELGPRHPLRTVMGDLATAAAVSRMHLRLLSAEAVAGLAREADREVDAAALYRSTDGNPFFVTEVLGAGGRAIPATVRDAVTARAARLGGAARDLLDAAAVIGQNAEIDVLLDVSGQLSAAVDECVALGVLTDRGTSVAFRHELARVAILEVLPPAARIDLHRRVLNRLLAGGSADHGRLVHHAVACADAAAVAVHAPQAARRAARFGGHREAAEYLRTAVQHGVVLPVTDRAELLEQLSYECYLTGRPAEALDARVAAVALVEAIGDVRRVGVGQRWMARLSWLLGRNADAERYATAAVCTLEPFGAGADLAMAYSTVSNLRMVGGTTEEALAWGRRALDTAQAAGSREVEAHALNNIGTALLRRGDLAHGRAVLNRSLDVALAEGLEEHAARAWTNIGILQATKRMLADADLTLNAGIAYCSEHDLDSAGSHMQGWLAGVLLEQGNAEAAVAMAQVVLRQPRLPLVTRIPALLATCLAAIRSGDPTADEQLAEVDGLARVTAEPQRLLGVALLQAEAAWTSGRIADIVPLTDEVFHRCNGGWEPWILGELAWWRMIGGAQDTLAFDLPDPIGLMRAGHEREASAAWTAIGRPFWAALALASGNAAETSEAVRSLLQLGAPASAHAVRRDLARRGRPVPRGPRSTARANSAGLTARELDVLGFLVEGMSDAEIAAQLTLSGRTVGHHVSAILRKLGVPSRSRAAASAVAILDRT